LWLHSLKVAQLLRSAACLHTNQSRSYLIHLVQREICRSGRVYSKEVGQSVRNGGMLVLMSLQRAAKHLCAPHSIRQSLPPFSLQSVIPYRTRFRCVLRTLRMEFLVTYKIFENWIYCNLQVHARYQALSLNADWL